jgi:hypothetical protein
MGLEIGTFEYAPDAFLEYVVQGAVVVYCGVTDVRQLSGGASTTNAAGAILKALAEIVGAPVDALAFFELTTHTSWVLPPGEYDFQSVRRSYDHQKECIVWVRARAPAAILEVFRHRIGGYASRYRPDPEDTIDDSADEI